MNSLLLTTVLILSIGQVETDAKAQSAARLKFLKETASQIEIRLQGDGAKQLELAAQPVLRWDNPRGSLLDGATYLWMLDHRPQAIGGVWIIQKGAKGIAHLEVHSVSQRPMVATVGGKPFWSPARPGIKWNPIPGSERSGATRGERLRQMKSIARRFVTYAVKNAPDYDEGSIWEFRMMATPIHRYAEEAAVDGAIFAFAQGTDPEVFLFLESREENGTSQWYYGFAGACIWELHGKLDDREVWFRPKAQRTPDADYAVVENFPVDPKLLPAIADKLD